MAKFGFANLTSLLFNFLTISNIIYNKQSFYDQLTSRNNWNAYYDYIIVGGGTAGSVLAARLTEDPDVSVLLLEAGGSETVTSNTPGLSETLIGTVMDWKWLTIPQNNSCLAMNSRQCHMTSGKVLGGTSSINRMYYLRGNPADFDLWETKFGLKSWSWKDVFPFMIRNENQQDPEKAKTGYYGLNGPVFIGKTPIKSSLSESPEEKILESFLLASKKLGYPIMDLNTGVSNGSSILQSTIYQGRRQSMSTAFLEPNLKNRQNLHVLANSIAVKILFENDRAIGIKFHRDWQQYSVFARQEVIISAGALHSPQLLMLSGIGPRNELNRHQIPVVSDLPGVGENFHDHVGSLGLYFVVNDLPEPSITKQHLKQYFYYGKGLLAESRYVATVFRSSNDRRHQLRSPDLMLLTYVNGLTNREISAELTEQQINLKRTVWNSYFGEKLKSNSGKLQFTILPIVLKPKSRGSVRLKSTNPFDAPKIDPNYLEHPDDLNQIVKAMREALRLVRLKPFEQLETKWYQSVVPGCEIEYQKFQSEIETIFSNLGDFPVPESNDAGPEPELFFTTEASYIRTPIQTQTSTTQSPKNHNNNNNQSTGSSGANLPFYFVSSFMSKLFRKSSALKKQFQKAGRQLKSFPTALNLTSPFYYDQYWLGHNQDNNSKMVHPLINKTIYGGLVDGFSSSLSNFDQSAITVWNSHSDRRQRPKPPMDDSDFDNLIQKTTLITTMKPEESLIPELPPGVQPIVLTGFFSSPPKTLAQPTMHTHHYRPTIIESPSSPSLSTKVSTPSKPDSDNAADQYLKCLARMMTMPLGDYVGTCRMGSKNDRHHGAVVDERFRVIGIRGLRVVDTSVVPEITTGGLAPVAIMLGERGAEFIREDRKHLKNGYNRP